jgi:hypothetical protein
MGGHSIDDCIAEQKRINRNYHDRKRHQTDTEWKDEYEPKANSVRASFAKHCILERPFQRNGPLAGFIAKSEAILGAGPCLWAGHGPQSKGVGQWQ